MKNIFIILLLPFAVLLSNCKKKEDNKPLDTDLEVFEIKDESSGISPLRFIALADNKFLVLTRNMNKDSYISIELIDVVFGAKKEILNRYNLIKPELKTGPHGFLANSNDKHGYCGLMMDRSTSNEFGAMFSKKENSDLVEYHYNINNGSNSVNYSTINEVSDGFVLTAPIYGYKKSGVYIEKFDKSFNSLWINQLYENVDLLVYNAPVISFKLPNDEMIIFSNLLEFPSRKAHSERGDFRLLKINLKGDSLFSKTYNFNDENWHIKSGISKGNKFYIVTSNGSLIHRLSCFDTVGNILWQKDFNNDVRIENIRASDKGIALIGAIERSSSNNFTYQFFVTELDVNGNKIWEETNGADNLHHYGQDIYIDGNFYYALVGQYPDDFTQSKTLIVKDKISY